MKVNWKSVANSARPITHPEERRNYLQIFARILTHDLPFKSKYHDDQRPPPPRALRVHLCIILFTNLQDVRADMCASCIIFVMVGRSIADPSRLVYTLVGTTVLSHKHSAQKHCVALTSHICGFVLSCSSAEMQNVY